jgi:hypothetical protein
MLQQRVPLGAAHHVEVIDVLVAGQHPRRGHGGASQLGIVGRGQRLTLLVPGIQPAQLDTQQRGLKFIQPAVQASRDR